MIKNLKKAFTIIELVIVIAVIAILAAVMIPTYSSLVKKANVSKDTQLVRNLNTALATNPEGHKTMYDALVSAEENGYDVAKINASATDNEILWDSVNDVFCYLNDGVIKYIPDTKQKDVEVEDYQYWQICTKEQATSDQKYSIYWNSEEDFTETLNVGFDAGENTTITELTYENTDKVKAVTIRTNSGKLTIDAELDTVSHYGTAGEVIIKGIANHSYHLYGKVDTLHIKKGHVVIEDNAETTNVIVESGDSGSENAPTVDNNGTITNVIGKSDNVNGNKPSNEISQSNTTLTTAGGYVKLEGDQTIDETLILGKDTVTILDLNGHTISFEVNDNGDKDDCNNGALIVKGKLTITDTSIDGKGTIKFADGYFAALVRVNDGGNLTLNGGTLINKRSKDGGQIPVVNVYANSTLTMNGGKIIAEVNEERTSFRTTGGIAVKGKDAKCYINGGVIEAEENPAIAGNGTSTEWYTYIEINGGTFKSEKSMPVYHPQVGTLIINGGYFEGKTVVYQKAGTMTINGGTFKAIGENKDYKYSSNGAEDTGDCIVIDSCKGYGNGATTASINIDKTNITVMDPRASKVFGYSYRNDVADAVIVFNGEQVESVNVK